MKIKAAQRLRAFSSDMDYETRLQMLSELIDEPEWGKIMASQRLDAVLLSPGVYPDAQGLEDIEGLQQRFDKNSGPVVGKDKNGFTFYWAGKKLNYLICVKDRTVVGYVELRARVITIHLDDRSLKTRQISVTFMDPEYRGRGLILGMHQYLITQFNLLSDDVYSPEGLNIWKQLKKLGHKIEVIDGTTQSMKSWTERSAVMLIRRGQ